MSSTSTPPPIDAARGGPVFRTAFAIWAVATLALLTAHAYLNDFYRNFLLWIAPGIVVYLVLLALWLPVPIRGVVIALRGLRRRAYGAAAGAALAPAIAAAVVLYGSYIGDYIRFEIERPAYVARIEGARRCDRFRDRQRRADRRVLSMGRGPQQRLWRGVRRVGCDRATA